MRWSIPPHTPVQKTPNLSLRNGLKLIPVNMATTIATRIQSVISTEVFKVMHQLSEKFSTWSDVPTHLTLEV